MRLFIAWICLGQVAFSLVNSSKRKQRGTLAGVEDFVVEKGAGCQSCGTGQASKPVGGSSGGAQLDCRAAGLKDCYQPPIQVKCCDASCPKCLGGIAPVPGSNGCVFGCPNGLGCPGTCPCDECVCCYTTTRWLTETSTCLDSTTVQVVQLDTSTEAVFSSTFSTLTVPVTFTVEDIFSFTSVVTFTGYPSRASTITSTRTSISTLPSTVHAQTVVLSAFLYTFVSRTTVTVLTPPISYVFDTANVTTTTIDFSTTQITTTVITGFSYILTGYAGTSTVGDTGTFYEFVSLPATLTVAGFTDGTNVFSTHTATIRDTCWNSVTITSTPVQTIDTTTRTATVTPTQTSFTTPLGPVPFILPFFRD